METNSINFSNVSNITCKKNKLKVCRDKVNIEGINGIIIQEQCKDNYYSIGIDSNIINQINQNTQAIQEIQNNQGNEISGSTQISGSSTITTLTAKNNTLCSVYVNIYALNSNGTYGWKRVQFDYGTANNVTTVYPVSLIYSNGSLNIDVTIGSSGNQIPIVVSTNGQVKWTIISNCESF